MSTRGAVLILLTAATVAGCQKPPQVKHDNRRLIQSLRTAVAAKRPQWLAANSKLIEDRHGRGELSDEEYATFHDIVALAQNGKWEDAQADVIRLEEAQEPTQAEIDSLKRPKK